MARVIPIRVGYGSAEKALGQAWSARTARPRAVLDTHALVFWRSDPSRLTPMQREHLEGIEGSGGQFAISAITLWELAKLVEHGKITTARPLGPFLGEIENHPRLAVGRRLPQRSR